MPAPDWHQFTMADGSNRELRLMGNEELAWYQDRNGVVYIYQEQQWFFGRYIETDGVGEVISTGVSVTNQASVPSESDSHLHPVPQAKIWSSSLNSNNSTRTPSYHLSSRIRQNQDTVTQPLLVVEVSFSDQQMTNDFTQTIFGQQGQSVRDYFLKNSYNKYVVTPARESQGTENDGVIAISLNLVHPDCHSKEDNTCTSKLNNVFKEAYKKVDQYIDLSTYDVDGDGYIEPSELSVMFVFAGYDRAAGSLNRPYIWPHKFSHNSETLDGVTIRDYCLFADNQGDHQSTMGVIAHELGHLMLGLPDLYSYQHQGSIGHWGLMGGGSWGRKPGDRYSGETPVNMTAWSKEAAGFLEPEVLNNNQSYTVATERGESVVYLDPYLQKMGPKLYLQNRRQVGYDRALSGEGVLATAVMIDNQFNSRGPMQVQIFQADGLDELSHGGWSDAGDLFPGSSNVTLLSDDSSPSLRLATAGRDTEISLSNIVSSPQEATLTLAVPDSRGKHAWVTSFSRQYAQFDQRIEALGFGVDVHHADTSLVGIQFYAQKQDPTLPIEYRLVRYPYQTNWRGEATFDVADGIEITRGQAQNDGGRLLLAQPVDLAQARHLLVLELTNAVPEYSTSFYDAYLSDGQHKEQFYASFNTLANGMMSNARGRIFPFAALLQTAVNPFPRAVDDAYQVQQGHSISLDLKANDQDLQVGNRYEIELLSQPKKGKLDGQRYTPFTHAEGTDRFEYRLRDSEGRVSNRAQVSVQISLPKILKLEDVNFTTREDQPLQLTLVKESTTQWQIVNPPQHGQVLGNQYFPERDYFGNDSFTFRVIDSQGMMSNMATVNINVLPVNDLHRFDLHVDKPYATAGEPVTFSVLNFEDVDSSLHRYQWQQVSGTQGQLSRVTDDQVVFTIAQDAKVGETVTLQVTVVDEEGNEVSKTAQVQVVDKTPEVKKARFKSKFGSQLLVDVLMAEYFGFYQVEITEPPEHGSAYMIGAHLHYQAPQSRFDGLIDRVSYRVTFDNGEVKSGWIEIELAHSTVPADDEITNPPAAEPKDESAGSVGLWNGILLLLLALRRRNS
ncbi:M6 family metalloprotease domain-containing protein [Vibrio navarrensis]